LASLFQGLNTLGTAWHFSGVGERSLGSCPFFLDALLFCPVRH
jgi:hypothetical protein